MTSGKPYPILSLPLAKVTLDERCRSRAALDPEVIAEYADLLRQGQQFPAATVFDLPLVTVHDDGSKRYFLSDGWLRFKAHEQAGRSHIEVEVRPGGFREARLHAAGSNTTHGLRRTLADKRRALLMVLEDEQARAWSTELIADHIGVSRPTVVAWRKAALELLNTPEQRTTLIERGAARAAPKGTAETGVEVVGAPLEEQHPCQLDLRERAALASPEADGEELDRMVLRERADRACRKVVRFAQELGVTPQELLADYERRHAAWLAKNRESKRGQERGPGAE